MTAPLPPDKLVLRYMTVRDIDQVCVIDEASFRPAWPAHSYRHEINESLISFMVVLETVQRVMVSGWRAWLKRWQGDPTTAVLQPVIVGYGGLWKVEQEAHISTIASHPDHRGKKYGELLLVAMLKRAIMLGAGYVVLEVRVSNAIAQALYRKYGFEIHGVKKNYYHHDREDAYDMRLDLSPQTIALIDARYQALLQSHPFDDHYSQVLHPRLGR